MWAVTVDLFSHFNVSTSDSSNMNKLCSMVTDINDQICLIYYMDRRAVLFILKFKKSLIILLYHSRQHQENIVRTYVDDSISYIPNSSPPPNQLT